MPSGSPAPFHRLVISWPSIVPTVRLTLRIGRSISTCWPSWIAGWAQADQLDVERVGEAVVLAAPTGAATGRTGSAGTARIGLMSRPAAFQWSIAARVSSASTWPIISAIVRKPSSAISSRTSSAMNSKNVSTNSGLAAEALAQLRVLGGDADRARVEVADAHHDAARHDERGGGEAELLGAEQGGDDDVAPGLQLAVGLHDDAVAQAVQQQRLLGLGEAELPRPAGVLQRRQRAGTRAAVVAGDQHDVCFRLADSGRNGADPDLGDELDVHARRRVGVLEVVDELLEVLDRVDVVVRRRADQADARASSAGSWRSTGTPCGPGSWPPSPGLAPWAILICRSSAFVRYSDVTPKRPDATCLIGRAAARVVEAVGVLAALAGVRLAAEAVHGDGQRLVGLGRDRAVAHGPGREAAHDRRRPARPRRSAIGWPVADLAARTGRAASPAASTGRRRAREYWRKMS